MVTFAVKQSNLEELERRLLAVSEPSSPEYGMHMGRDAVDELVAPAAASLAAVHGMLGQHSVDVDGCKRRCAARLPCGLQERDRWSEAEARAGGVEESGK